MTAASAGFRCSVASLLREDSPDGTASTVRAFLLIEHSGSWGVDALRDARLPAGLGKAVTRAAAVAKIRPLLIRRPDRRSDAEGTRVFAAFTQGPQPWLETVVLSDPGQLLDLDLAALGSGRSPGLTPYDGSLFCVCTHGRHDTCCAERGRPVAAALSAAHPEETWEVSHIGGDRFAGNMLVLPQGLYYGRLDAESVIDVARSQLAGELELDHLRGRSSHSMPLQFAETALRRQLGELRHDSVRLVSRHVVDDVLDAVFANGEAHWKVRVRTTNSPDLHRLTCRATIDNPVPQHELLGVDRVI